MSGITTGVGLFSGIDTGSLINQLLSIEARPRDLAQRRILQLQMQQSAYLDINSKLGALRTAAKSFRLDFIFDSMGATSTDDSVLSATASRTAVPGSYSFIVDRMVSSQQLLSRGFVDQDATAVGATSFTFESALGRLDRDIALADLNNGEGIERGEIVITQGSDSETVDLSRAATVNDVLEAINASGLDVTATVSGGQFVLSGGTDFTVANGTGYTTAESLGIAGASTGGTLSGSTIYEMTETTTLAELNDGNGVLIGTDVGESRYDFTLTVDNGITPVEVNVNLGSIWETVDDELTETAGAVSTVGGVIDRINMALTDAGLDAEVSAAVSGGRIVISDTLGREITVTEKDDTSDTAAHLGLAGAATGTLTGERVLAGLNTTLLANINGGSGLAGTGVIDFTARDGTSFSVDISSASTVDELIALVNEDATNAGRITLSLNPIGNGLLVTDSTGGASNLIVAGDSAASLGIATDAAGVASDSVTGASLQHQYVSMATPLDSLNGGEGIGTGEFQITDGNGVILKVDIGSDTQTVYDLIREVNGQASALDANIEMRINDNGDGIVITERSGEPAGAAAISVEDLTGSVAANLKIEGEASGIGADNYIDGSAEVVVEFEATDTLQDIADAINDAGGPARATIINDGTGSNPYRLSFAATSSGTAGRFLLDDGGLGLNLRTLDSGQDSRVFYGSADPATAVLLTSSSNTLDSVIPGVSIDLKSASEDPVTVTVTRDTEKIVTAVQSFITAYNAVVDRIGFLTRYDAETETKGPLLGDATLTNLRSALARTVLAEPTGVDDDFGRLTEVGFEVGEGGVLSLDSDKFRQAMESDFQAVADLLAAREVIPPETETEIGDGITVRNTSTEEEFSRLGVVFMFEELADEYLDSVDGILTGKDKTIISKIELQEERIENFNKLLDIKRQRLEAQFLAMEQALASLQTQQSSLLSLMQNMG